MARIVLGRIEPIEPRQQKLIAGPGSPSADRYWSSGSLALERRPLRGRRVVPIAGQVVVREPEEETPRREDRRTRVIQHELSPEDRKIVQKLASPGKLVVGIATGILLGTLLGWILHASLKR